MYSFPTPTTPVKPAGQKTYWPYHHGSARSLAMASYASKHFRGLTLVLCKDAEEARRIDEEIGYFIQGNNEIPVLHFPDWETLPYDAFSPHQDIISERLHTLYQLTTLEQAILIVPITTLANKLPPVSYIKQNSLLIDPAVPLSCDKLRRDLEQAGYTYVNTVYEHGEFTVRGSIIDMFPMGSNHPFRIDLIDDDIDSIRTFDPETQRTIEKVSSISLLPAREFPLDKEGINRFCDQWHESFPDRDATICPVYEDVASGLAPPGIEYYLPLFFESTANLLDYIQIDSQVFVIGDVHGTANHYWEDIRQRHEDYGIDVHRPLMTPTELFHTPEAIFEQLKRFPQILFQTEPEQNAPALEIEHIKIEGKDIDALDPLDIAISNAEDKIIFFSTESPGRQEALLELLEKIQCTPKPIEHWSELENTEDQHVISVTPLSNGFESDQILVITETELFGQQVYQQRRRKQAQDYQQDAIVKNLNELQVGSPVVHIEHGIGRYRGMVSLTINEQPGEFLHLEYADDATLYIPVSSLHLISRYSGADEAVAPLHRLGSDQWQKARKKAAEKVKDVAAELLDIYSRREAREGYAYPDPGTELQQFRSEFPFEETPDQVSAIDAVCKDMYSERPMDRLICGDVGFGKTEVAMHAAFVAAHNEKQVAILVPTTLLAQQHYENFKDRFAKWPLKVEVISRFKTAKEQAAIIQSLQDGDIDIIIGTHKLLASDIKFNQLGLLIIDEEHRFGVQQKERLKALRSEVDILTLTATPIPRTLNMAMSGMRDLSIIASPPAKRLSVKTFVRQKDKATIKEAIHREILRGGQVFYLHNDIQTIERTREELQELIPEARIAVGHGQMRERLLEKVMADFYHKHFNILICTTIIETGIDIPSANTIIIERADKFGLAQLHQLRGRVGRSHHQAYAYLLTPDQKSITNDAKKRLEAIQLSQDLGSGFTLATHDLEIRGAGELLGEAQSGQIQSIGFSLYIDMLERAVDALRNGETPDFERDLFSGAEVDMHLPSLIPDDYLPDTQNRLILYKRIASARDDLELKDLQIEMIDRFGLLPDATKTLFRVASIKLKTGSLGIKKLDAGDKGGKIEFSDNTGVNPLTLVNLIQEQPRVFQLQGANTLKFTMDLENPEVRFTKVLELIETLSKTEDKAA